MFAVDVRISGTPLPTIMSQMRDWLDAHRSQPAVFRHLHTDGVTEFRVEFASRDEAEAFARHFKGQVSVGHDKAIVGLHPTETSGYWPKPA